MKLPTLALCLCLTGCGTTFTATHQVGDGKAYVSSDGASFNVGYRGTFGQKSGKGVVPVEPSREQPKWLDTVLGWFR